MSKLLFLVLVIRIAAIVWAMAWSLYVLRRLRDRRMGFLTALLGLMAMGETLTLLGRRDLGLTSAIGAAAEQTGIVLSVALFIAVPFLAKRLTEHKSAEDALRASEERYRDLVENARDIIYSHDLNGNYTSVNKAVEQITGFTRDEALKLNFGQTVAPEHVETARQMIAAKLAGQKETVYDLEIIGKDGRRITVEVNTRLVLQDNIPIGIQGIARDITERKRTEEALSESRAHLQAILDNCPAMIFEKDLDGRYQQINRQFERTFDLTPEQVLGRTDDELFPPELAAAFRATDRSVLEAGRALEFEESAVYGDGLHTYIVHKFPLLDAAGDAYAVGGISTDITARKRADQLLRRQAAQLAALHEIELEISAESELPRVLDIVTHRAAELLDASHCNTFIRERDEAALTLVASLKSQFIGLRLEGGEGLAGRALITGEGQGVDDYGEWQGRAHVFDAEELGPALAAPLKWQQTVIGVITLARKRGEALFTREDSRLLEQLVAEAAIAIHQAKLFDEVQENQNRLQILSRRLIDAQEAERKRLARELHDQIGQALTAVQITLQTFQSSRDGESSHLDDCLTAIDEALQQTHDLSLDLRPSLLDDLGLEAALRWYVDRVARRAGLARRFKADALEPRLAPQVETACFRIAQEALTNVLRHARAATIWVQVTQRRSTLQLVVRDDGVGFDVRKAMSRTGVSARLGLQGMQERAAALGGVVDITSQPGNGAQVQVSFPLTLPHCV